MPTTGEKCSITGTYAGKCKKEHACGPVRMDAGDTFPPCPSCKHAVDWRKTGLGEALTTRPSVAPVTRAWHHARSRGGEVVR